MFEQTPPGDVEMLYIKEPGLACCNGAQLMDHSQPCLVELAASYKGAWHCLVLCCNLQKKSADLPFFFFLQKKSADLPFKKW
jgi:hypothetical protein